jgi:hypothetical protein
VLEVGYMLWTRRKLNRVARSKPQPRCPRQIIAAVALLALVATALAPGEVVEASAHIPASTSVHGVAAQVGQAAPEFFVTTLDGLSLTSADLRAQEKPYVLYFFASW